MSAEVLSRRHLANWAILLMPVPASSFFEAKNVTNTNYAATTGVTAKQSALNQAQFLPGDGTAFYGGVEWDW